MIDWFINIFLDYQAALEDLPDWELEALSALVDENAQNAHDIETRAARKFKFKTAPANRLRLGGKERSEKKPCGNTTRKYLTCYADWEL